MAENEWVTGLIAPISAMLITLYLHSIWYTSHFAVEVYFFKADWSFRPIVPCVSDDKNILQKSAFFTYPLRINKVTSQFFNGKMVISRHEGDFQASLCRQVFPARQGSNAINVKVLGIFASLLAEYSQSSPGGFNTLFGGVWLTVFIKTWLFGNTSSIVACSPPHFPPPPTTMSVE